MPSPDPSLVLVRLLSAVHALAALAGALFGIALAGSDYLDGDSGMFDGLGIVIGLVLLGLCCIPLALAVAALRSADPFVVRWCGLFVGVTGVTANAWSGFALPLLAVPGALLVVVALGSIVASIGRPGPDVVPIRLPGRRA